MRDIVRLLLGDNPDGLLDRFSEGDGDGFGLAEQARRAGEWCGSTPGRGSAAGAARSAARPRGTRRQAVTREFRNI